jgi:hypothetical protein
MYRTEAYELITAEDGRVVGVKATKYDGTKVEVTATRGVIMATGGYGDNIELVKSTNNYWNSANLATGKLYTTNRNTSTGVGMLMAEDAGAALIGTGFMQLMPSGYFDDGKLCGASGPSLIYIAPVGPMYRVRRASAMSMKTRSAMCSQSQPSSTAQGQGLFRRHQRAYRGDMEAAKPTEITANAITRDLKLQKMRMAPTLMARR